LLTVLIVNAVIAVVAYGFSCLAFALYMFNVLFVVAAKFERPALYAYPMLTTDSRRLTVFRLLAAGKSLRLSGFVPACRLAGKNPRVPVFVPACRLAGTKPAVAVGLHNSKV
jgi:hypothetical protein